MNKDYSISVVRLLAICSIVVCHIMSYFGNELARWLDVGVPIFFFISGYLFSNKTINSGLEFYKKRFRRILVPYYIFITISLLIVFFFDRCNFTVSNVISLLILRGGGTIVGLGHLWFIPYILLCYLITPFLLETLGIVKKTKHDLLILGACVIGAVIFCEFFATFYNSAWIVAYILGIFFGGSKSKKIITSISVIGIFGNIIQISIDYLLCIELNGVVLQVYSRFCNYMHVALGILIFVIVTTACKKVMNSRNYCQSKIGDILDITDNCSYNIYLIHQFFCLGSFSLLGINQNKIFSTTVTLLIIIISAVILNILENGINTMIDAMEG